MKQTSLLGSHAHSLTIYGIEPANRVAEREQPARECLEPLEMLPHAGWKAEASDFAEPFGSLDCIVDGRGRQLLRI